MTDSPHKMLPLPDADSRFFWEAGRNGVLRILGCNSCDHLIQPPSPICPKCHSHEVGPREMSGRGTVWSFTVNHHPWFPDMKLPYVLASVELDEQPGLRLTTHIADTDPRDVAIGMKVEVIFREEDDVWIPNFRPLPI